jgi:hypothetical protein
VYTAALDASASAYAGEGYVLTVKADGNVNEHGAAQCQGQVVLAFSEREEPT